MTQDRIATLSFLKEFIASIPNPVIIYNGDFPIWSNCFAQEEDFIPTTPFTKIAIAQYTIVFFCMNSQASENNVVTFYTHSLDRSVSRRRIDSGSCS